MKKIPTIFVRNPDNMKELLPVLRSDCEWVLAGEGIPTRKYDGTCCMIDNGKLWKRREIKPGKMIPEDFVREQIDKNTHKLVGWTPVDCNDKQDKWHCEAFTGQEDDGTYELCGPKIQGNPEGFGKHVLIPHATAPIFDNCPTSYEELEKWLASCEAEGVVWHHPDGRMAKIKKRDFNLKR